MRPCRPFRGIVFCSRCRRCARPTASSGYRHPRHDAASASRRCNSWSPFPRCRQTHNDPHFRRFRRGRQRIPPPGAGGTRPAGRREQEIEAPALHSGTFPAEKAQQADAGGLDPPYRSITAARPGCAAVWLRQSMSGAATWPASRRTRIRRCISGLGTTVPDSQRETMACVTPRSSASAACLMLCVNR